MSNERFRNQKGICTVSRPRYRDLKKRCVLRHSKPIARCFTGLRFDQLPRRRVGIPPRANYVGGARPIVADYLGQDDRVIGVARGQEARAYPLKILDYHEIVNDRVNDEPVAVTYCPLCDSAAVFDRRTPLGEREFGVSGLLYNSNVLMYDRSGQAESLWSQIKAEGVSGPGAQSKLKALPVELTTWGDWRLRNPHAVVLSPQTGHSRDYRRDPYVGYFQRPGLMFPAQPTSDRLPTKERVLGVWTGTAARAYPISAFGRDPVRVVDKVGGKQVVIEFIPVAQSIRVADADEGVEWMYSLWFAWYAFHPNTEIYAQ
jgi:hypothetical protein